MTEPTKHKPQVEISEYLPLKRRMLRDGLFSCSQVGFNIAFDPLAGLRTALAGWFASLDSSARHWEVPPLIRADWVVYGVWQRPPEEQWCREEPGGHLLTPRPLFHLINRLRHHPEASGCWLLTGWATRNEDPDNTLPLMRQRTFTCHELAQIGTRTLVTGWAESMSGRIWRSLTAWDLPVMLSEYESEGCLRTDISLELPGEPPVLLVRSAEVPRPVMEAYNLDGYTLSTVATGLERLCLAVIARHGTDPIGWPLAKPAELSNDQVPQGGV